MNIPTTCRAAVVKNEGAGFFLAIEEVNVPEPGKQFYLLFIQQLQKKKYAHVLA